MQYRDFGKTGLKVSEVGFGGWAIGGGEHGNSYGLTDDKTSLLAVQKAIDLGCNFFDTADVYGWGHGEELLGKALKGKREHLLIATKVGADFYQGAGFQTFTAQYIRYALEKSLARLKTDYIDVYQLHNPPLRLINQESTYEIMKQLKQEGKVRAWGLSIFDPAEGLSALGVGHPDSLQVTYNLFNKRASEALFPKAKAAGCAIIAREPLASGFLTGKYANGAKFDKSDFRSHWPASIVISRAKAAEKLSFLALAQRTLAQSAIKYALANHDVTVAIAGVKSVEQAVENFTSSEATELSAEELLRIKDLQAHNFEL